MPDLRRSPRRGPRRLSMPSRPSPQCWSRAWMGRGSTLSRPTDRTGAQVAFSIRPLEGRISRTRASPPRALTLPLLSQPCCPREATCEPRLEPTTCRARRTAPPPPLAPLRHLHRPQVADRAPGGPRTRSSPRPRRHPCLGSKRSGGRWAKRPPNLLERRVPSWVEACSTRLSTRLMLPRCPRPRALVVAAMTRRC